MKIVQINAVNRFSSTGLNTWDLHQYLKSIGHESFIFCTNENKPNENIYQIGCSFDYKLHSFFSHLFGNQGSYSIIATHKLINKLKKIKPDIVHLGNLHSNFINLRLLLNFLASNDIATSLTLHDCWFFTGHCCYFTDTNCDRWQTGCGNCPDLRNWNNSWFIDNSRKNLKLKSELFSKIPRLAVIGVSQWVTDFMPRSILKNASIIKAIYNWIDTDVFRPRETITLREKLNLSKTDFVVLGVAQTWNRQKGLYAFIDLAKMMPQCKFLMAGDLKCDTVLPQNIVTIGATSNLEKLSELYSLADVFFMPSIRETFGKVTAEALCCGTPVVAYNVTATPELIAPNCGYVIEQGDLNTARDAIEEIMTRGKNYFSKSCREYAIRTFSKNILMNQYLEVFRAIQ